MQPQREPLDKLIPARRRKMVGWYDPKVLARSAVLVTIANLFGRHSDTRLIEALASQPQQHFSFADGRRELWLDFVADLGDGWNSTYAIASSLAEAELSVAAPDGTVEITRGGDVLVFGGDEVYPYPSKTAYGERTETPYATAFAGTGRYPEVFAVPGNHDWYDSLVAFSRVFCRPERGFAGCRTAQTRSYFALRLPGDWWLLAIDLQLGADLDEPQVRYFQQVAHELHPGSNVVLCVPDPQWIYAKSYPGHPSYEDETLRFIEQRILRHKIAVFLTGDLHFYKRHERDDGVQKIVSGGGGAFLHPTHAPTTDYLQGGFRERACYPSEKTSARLTWRAFLFPFLNPSYMWIPALLYSMSAWLASASLDVPDTVSLSAALSAAVNGAVRDPFNGLWLILFLAAFVFFTDTHVRWYRVLGGLSHGASHLLAAFGLGWIALLITTRGLGLEFGTVAQLLSAGALTFVGGGVVGSVVLGVYLFLSLSIFGRHANEAFSALHVEDYKQWLRMRFDAATKELTLYAICIDRVPRRWQRSKAHGQHRYAARDARATPPRLIEKVVLRPRGDGHYDVSGISERGRRLR
jgi:hypothetical protein